MNEPVNLDANIVIEEYRRELTSVSERLIVAHSTVRSLEQLVASLRSQLAPDTSEDADDVMA